MKRPARFFELGASAFLLPPVDSSARLRVERGALRPSAPGSRLDPSHPAARPGSVDCGAETAGPGASWVASSSPKHFSTFAMRMVSRTASLRCVAAGLAQRILDQSPLEGRDLFEQARFSRRPLVANEGDVARCDDPDVDLRGAGRAYGRTALSWRTRKSFDWIGSASSAISPRKRVPTSAARPGGLECRGRCATDFSRGRAVGRAGNARSSRTR